MKGMFMPTVSRLRIMALLAAMALAAWMAWPTSALAQTVDVAPAASAPATSTTPTVDVTPASGSASNQVCTDIKGAKQRAFSTANKKPGLLSDIYTFITTTVNDATKKLFNAFTKSQAYQAALMAAATMMIVFFGVAFTIGLVQASFQQVLVRLIKLGLIFAALSPSGWSFFSDTVVKFFMTGTDDMVKGVIAIGTGVRAPAGATPFYQLDQLGDMMIQPDTLVMIFGSLGAGGPYGMMMGGLMMIAIWGMMGLLINALKTYATTFVARSLLLGVAPIFLVFMLFDRTKQMFMSWLQALLAMSLQPILLFTFLSFFMLLIESAAKDMMSAELCWTQFTNGQGFANNGAFWRFKDPKTGQLLTSEMTWEGALSCVIEGKRTAGGTAKPCSEFPINIIDVLSFLILVYIAQRFADVIDRIANELSNTFISLDAGSKIDQFMKQASKSMG